jgi:two-component system sensor histidine kinase YesM
MEFGEQYGISVATREGCYTKVCVRIPMRRVGL